MPLPGLPAHKPGTRFEGGDMAPAAGRITRWEAPGVKIVPGPATKAEGWGVKSVKSVTPVGACQTDADMTPGRELFQCIRNIANHGSQHDQHILSDPPEIPQCPVPAIGGRRGVARLHRL